MSWLKKPSRQEMYLKGIQDGYQMAWDTMLPLMQDGLVKAKGKLKDQTINETLRGLGLKGDTSGN